MSRSTKPFQREDVLTVIRTTGERTTELCELLVSEQVIPDNITFIHETTSSLAVSRTFELGLEYGMPWTIAIDADVLIYSRAIHSLVGLAEQSPAATFHLAGRLIDKLSGGPICIGLHIYRTTHLDHALKVTKASGIVPRLESQVIQQMKTAGYVDAEVDAVLGLHDFEQDYRDLYRKGFMNARNHADCFSILERMWDRLAKTDDDLLAVLSGGRAAQAEGEIKDTNFTTFPDDLQTIGLSEKRPIDLSCPPFADLDGFIRSLETPDEFIELQNCLSSQTTPPPNVLTRVRDQLRIRSRVHSLFIRTSSSARGRSREVEVTPHVNVKYPPSFFGPVSRLYRSLMWHKADHITPEFARRVSQSAPISCSPDAPVELHSLVDHERLWTFVLGAKTMLRFIRDLHVVLHDDGSLTERDYCCLQEHIPSIRVIGRAEADSRMASALLDFPACRSFRDNNIVMAQVFDFPILAETEKLVAFDSDILIHSSPDEVAAWMSDPQSTEVLFEEATAPFCPRIDGIDITTRQDVPFRFAKNVCGGFVCGFKSMYELPLIEEYCNFVVNNCHDRLYRAQTITALSIAHSSYTARPLPGTYQNLFTFAPNPVMRHYYFSGLPPTAFLTDARKLLKQLN